ncbi:MAG: GNAT family N-acetyltransferase [Flavobacteriaceae bacterium]|nr:GNAT family N-acetyltransferase [Flavobacteriaceae bacterium]|tara:strand:+ start:153296 stop:153802 length:507 start_codon:yes stop_codon:yes gene_type:complete
MYISFETDRLKIRPIALTDAAFIAVLVNTKGWLEFIGDRNISDENDAKKYIQKILDNENFYYSTFELKDSQTPIGLVTFLHREEEEFPDFGFAMLPNYENNGYAFEASSAYLNKLKASANHQQFLAITKPSNAKSIKLILKLGFQFDKNSTKEDELLSYYRLDLTNNS